MLIMFIIKKHIPCHIQWTDTKNTISALETIAKEDIDFIVFVQVEHRHFW